MMYDNLYYRDKLPSLKLRGGQSYNDIPFQTKTFVDLDVKFKDGSFFIGSEYHHVEYAYTQIGDGKNEGVRNFLVQHGKLYYIKNGFKKIGWSEDWWKHEMFYNGDIHFYKHFGNQFREFLVKIDKGKVVSIKRINEFENR